MPQQINLYDTSLCQRHAQGALLPLLAGAATVGAIALLGGAALRWQSAELQDRTAETTARTEALRGSLQALGAASGTRELQTRVEQLRAREAGLQRLQTLLDTGAAGRREGHVALLEALARQAHPSVWLTGFSFLGGDDAIELQGRMPDASMLPAYLRHLQAEPQFRGRSFATLQLRRVESGDTDPAGLPAASGTGYSEFTLRSQVVAPSKP